MKRWMRLGLTATIATSVVTGLVGGAPDVSARGRDVTYVSPSFGLTFEYDGRVWSPFMDVDGTEEDGVDFLGLESDEVRGGFLIEMHDRLDDADDCLEDVTDVLLEDIEDAELKEDDDGEPIEGSSDGVAYAAYSYQKDGVFFSSYTECHEFGDGIGVISFSLISEARGYDDAMELVEPVIDSLDTSEVHEAGEGEDDRDRDEDDEDRDQDDEDADDDREEDEDSDEDSDRDDEETSDRDDEDDRDEDDRDEDDRDEDDRDDEDEDDGGELAESGVYESELFGFTLPYNDEHWTLDDVLVDDGKESAQLFGPDDESLSIISVPSDGNPPAAYTEYYVETLGKQLGVEMEVYEHPTTGETLDRQRPNEAYTLYYFEYDGVEFIVYVHAVTSDDGHYIVMVAGISVLAGYDLFEEDVFTLLDQIEF